jgi:hypothetical protein
VDYKDYQEFVVQASHTTVDEVSFRLLRAAAGLVAENDEFIKAETEEDFNSEQGDVVFWLTVLDYWITELKIEPTPIEPMDTNATVVYILDRVEKYSRNRDPKKLGGVAFVIKESFKLMTEFEDGKFISEVMERNYDKLSRNPREVK